MANQSMRTTANRERDPTPSSLNLLYAIYDALVR